MKNKKIPLLFGIMIVLIYFLSANTKIYAQQDGDAISLGKYKILQSKILNENRRLLIHLPRDYTKNNRHYPVFYMLYGNHTTTYFAEVVSVLDRLGPTGRIPEMILIGLENTDRYRDLLPLRGDGSTSGINNFISFFKQELIPWAEKTYRCKNYRMIFGPQAGANFVFYTLFKDPKLFNSGIITNPFRWAGGRDLNLNQAKEVLKKTKVLKKTLFITYNDNDELERIGAGFVESFSNFAKENMPDGFNLYLNHKKNWDEFLAPIGIREGLKAIFKNYPFADESQIKSLGNIKNHFDKLSLEYDYTVDISEHFLVTQYDRLLRVQNNKEAEEILDFILEKNPKSTNGLWRRADIHYGKGDLPRAIASLEQMIIHMGSDSGMVKNRISQYKKMLTDSAAYAIFRALLDSGLKTAKRKYLEIKESKELYFSERELNIFGYQLMGKGKMEEVVFIFKINVEKFPKSPSVTKGRILGSGLLSGSQYKVYIGDGEIGSQKLPPDKQPKIGLTDSFGVLFWKENRYDIYDGT